MACLSHREQIHVHFGVLRAHSTNETRQCGDMSVKIGLGPKITHAMHHRVPKFSPMSQCVVHALKGLACRACVPPASSPASHCKQCLALTSPLLHAHGCTSPFRTSEVTKNIIFFQWVQNVCTQAVSKCANEAGDAGARHSSQIILAGSRRLSPTLVRPLSHEVFTADKHSSCATLNRQIIYPCYPNKKENKTACMPGTTVPSALSRVRT
jgi:hypothetical protein